MFRQCGPAPWRDLEAGSRAGPGVVGVHPLPAGDDTCARGRAGRSHDFGPGRDRVWPNIDDQHYQLHGQGPGWAEVTEGSSVAGGVWEREKYTWDAAKGTVGVETIESNTWGHGSR